MELIELLKKFKKLKPNPDYSRKSRMVVLSKEESNLPVLSFSLQKIAAGVLRSGWSMALTAVLLLLTMGSFSVLKILSPATTAVVDVTGLRVEAQAIDAQIELTNVAYNAPAGIENKTSTAMTALRGQVPAERERIADGNATGAENADVQMTIDSVLDTLSK